MFLLDHPFLQLRDVTPHHLGLLQMPLITSPPIRRDMPIDSFEHVMDDGVQRRP